MTDTIDRIVRLLPTLNDAHIAREIKCSREYVRQVRNAYKIKNPAYRVQVCGLHNEEELTVKVIDLTRKHKSHSFIAKELEVGVSVINRILKDLGIKSTGAFKKLDYCKFLEHYKEFEDELSEFVPFKKRTHNAKYYADKLGITMGYFHRLLRLERDKNGGVKC